MKITTCLFALILLNTASARAQNTPLSLSVGLNLNQCRVNPLLNMKGPDGSVQSDPSFNAISSLSGYSWELGIRLDSSWSIGLAYSRSTGKTGLGYTQTELQGDSSHSYPVTFFLGRNYLIVSQTLSVKPSYSFKRALKWNQSSSKILQKMDLKLALDVGYARLQEESAYASLEQVPASNSWRDFKVINTINNLSGKTLSLAPSVRAEYAVYGKMLLLGLETGYRLQNFAELKDSDGSTWKMKSFADPSSPAASLSGFFIRPSLRVLF